MARKRRYGFTGCEWHACETREKAEAFLRSEVDPTWIGGIVEFPDGPRVVTFERGDTGEAYDSSQCWESIESGDVLVAEHDRVVGILLDAWPTAVTEAHGHFHTFREGFGWDDEVAKVPGLAPSLELARAEIARRGWR